MDNQNNDKSNLKAPQSGEVETTVLQLKILDRLYNVKCAKEDSESMLKAAQKLNEKLDEFVKLAPKFNHEQLCVLLALDLSHEIEKKDLLLKGFQDKLELRMREIKDTFKDLIS